MNENFLRLIFSDIKKYDVLVFMGPIDYRIAAVDESGNIVDGPTEWSTFTCY